MGGLVKRAIVLVAGKGSRLLPITKILPKCFVEVCGKPILLRLLESLDKLGIKETILVTGYLEGEIRKLIGNKFLGMNIIYVKNEIYYKTNNIYSLWLARDYLKGDLLIFGGDILIKEQVLKELTEDKNQNVGVLSKFTEDLDGTVVDLNSEFIFNLYLKKDQDENFDFSDKFKTVNIFKFSADFMENTFIKYLEELINEKNYDDFYEITIQRILKDKKYCIHAKVIPEEDWFEVDTQRDLELAEGVVRKW